MVFVGFSTPRRWNPLSWAIRLATRSKAEEAAPAGADTAAD